MQISDKGLRLIKAFEGCLRPLGNGTFAAYFCPAGKLTIGYGHTNDHGRRFTAKTVWTKAECEASLAEDMKGFENVVERLVKVPLSQHQFDALVSFSYNCGEGNFSKSTLLRRINAKDFEGAAQEFQKWTKGGGKVLKGLIRRRASEALLFQGIPDADYDGRPDTEQTRAPLPMPQQVDPPPIPPTPTESKTLWSVVGQLVATLGTGVGALLSDWRVVVAAGLLVVFFALFIGRERLRKMYDHYV